MKTLTDYINRCGECKHYQPVVKDGQTYHFGHCMISGKYKQSCAIKCKRNYQKGDDSNVH